MDRQQANKKRGSRRPRFDIHSGYGIRYSQQSIAMEMTPCYEDRRNVEDARPANDEDWLAARLYKRRVKVTIFNRKSDDKSCEERDNENSTSLVHHQRDMFAASTSAVALSSSLSTFVDNEDSDADVVVVAVATASAVRNDSASVDNPSQSMEQSNKSIDESCASCDRGEEEVEIELKNTRIFNMRQ